MSATDSNTTGSPHDEENAGCIVDGLVRSDEKPVSTDGSPLQLRASCL